MGLGPAFIIRQHRQTLRYELLGQRRKIGRCPTGMLYEQKARLWDADGKPMEVRRGTISGYYLAGELAAAYHGMMIAVPPAQWTRHFASLTPSELARILKTLAANVRPGRFRKNVRGPKKEPPKRTCDKRHSRVSTARILAQRQQHKQMQC